MTLLVLDHGCVNNLKAQVLVPWKLPHGDLSDLPKVAYRGEAFEGRGP